jgi:transcriptional coactivator p15 (PC4)
MSAMGKKKNATSLAPTGAPTEDVVVGEWLATKRELLRVMVRDFKGHTLIDIRRWYRDAGGKLCPGKGVSCRTGDVKPLRKALRKADRRLSGR